MEVVVRPIIKKICFHIEISFHVRRDGNAKISFIIFQKLARRSRQKAPATSEIGIAPSKYLK